MSGRRFWLAGLAALLLPAGAAAQEDDQPQMYFVHQEIVKPSMISQYEAAAADWVKMLQSSAAAREKITYSAFSGPQAGFVYVVPVDGFADFADFGEAFESVAEALGERWDEVSGRSDAAVDHFESGFYIHRPNMSYEPENPRLGEDEARMVHWDFWYALPGKTEELEAVAKEFVELYSSKGIDTGWNVYEAISGGELPLYVVAVVARDEADFYANEARLNELTGEEGQELGTKALKFARRVDPMIVWMRPDLSFPGEMALAAPE